MKTFESTCNKLNNILSDLSEDYILKINLIIDKEVFYEGGGLYWDRELFIDCYGDDNLCKKLVRTHPEQVMFVPTGDPIEHPGIKLAYKPEFSKKRY